MIEKQDELYRDFEVIQQIGMVPTMLDVVCRITGMGFAAVARVTEDRWLACRVKDDVNFGLAEGGELKIETTICNEIRDSREPVIIDEVATDERFCAHHTPKMYGLQSYISFPIILKNGSFFGTLCAIDSKPFVVSKPEIVGTFKLFAELLAFHIDSVELIDRSHSALKASSKILNHVSDENELYKKISSHNIQEQVRKISIFSNILKTSTGNNDIKAINETAEKINVTSQELSNMIQRVTRFVEIEDAYLLPVAVMLNEVISDINTDLKDQLFNKKITIKTQALPTVYGNKHQLNEVFVQLFDYAINFSDGIEPVVINIYENKNTPETSIQPLTRSASPRLSEILIEQQGLLINEYQLKDMFDLFIHSEKKHPNMRYDSGLAHSRKVIQNHGGDISARLVSEKKILFSITLPVEMPVATARANRSKHSEA